MMCVKIPMDCLLSIAQAGTWCTHTKGAVILSHKTSPEPARFRNCRRHVASMQVTQVVSKQYLTTESAAE